MSDRYSRQVLFERLGQTGQRRLGASSALLVGCGALGSLVSEWLVRAGVGRLRIVDRDFVEESNLHRQVLFDEEDARHAIPKAVAAERRLRAINSTVVVEGVIADVTSDNIATLARGCDLILDGSDNFEVRYLINDLSVRDTIPWIYAGAVGSYGATMNVLPGETACLRCMFETPPPPGTSPTCDTAGVLGPVVGVISSLEAAEAIKLLSGRRERMSRDLVAVDVWEGRVERIRPRRRSGAAERQGGRQGIAGGEDVCPVCVGGSFDHLEGACSSRAGVMCGRDSLQVVPASRTEMDLEGLARRLAAIGEVTANRFLVRVRVGHNELTVFRDGRAIVSGTTDPGEARALYARYIGV